MHGHLLTYIYNYVSVKVHVSNVFLQLIYNQLSLFRGLAVSENISEDEDPESESVLGIVPHQVS